MQVNTVGHELRSLHNLIRRYFEFSSHRHEIESATSNNGWIIAFLSENEERDIFQKDIEEYFTITKSTASKVLSLMEQKGLVERRAVSADARLRKIVLTDKARGLSKIMQEDGKNMEAALLDGFSPEEIRTLLGYISRMKHNIASRSASRQSD